MTAKLVKSMPTFAEPDLTEIMAAQKEFHDKFKIPRNADMQELYIKLIEEEHEEWIEDFYDPSISEHAELKELADTLYVTAGLVYQMGYVLPKANKYTEMSSFDYAISDLVALVATGRKDKNLLSQLMYCIMGYADSLGWDLNEAYRRVHVSNLSKLDDNGNPVYREDGKVMKGPNYKPPSLEDLTNGQ